MTPVLGDVSQMDDRCYSIAQKPIFLGFSAVNTESSHQVIDRFY